MLTDDGIENGKKKNKQTNKATTTTTATMIGPVSKKKNDFARAALLFAHFFAIVVTRLQGETF